jgi:hypothetical protein
MHQFHRSYKVRAIDYEEKIMLRRTLTLVVVIALCALIAQANTGVEKTKRSIDNMPRVRQDGVQQRITEISTNVPAEIKKSWRDGSARGHEIESLEASGIDMERGTPQQLCCNKSYKAPLSESKSYEHTYAAKEYGMGESDLEKHANSPEEGYASSQMPYEMRQQATTSADNNDSIISSTSRRQLAVNDIDNVPSSYNSDEAEKPAELASVSSWEEKDANVSGREREQSTYIAQQEAGRNETGGVEPPISEAYDYDVETQPVDQEAVNSAIQEQEPQEASSAIAKEMTGAEKKEATTADITDTESALQVASGQWDGRSIEYTVEHWAQNQTSSEEQLRRKEDREASLTETLAAGNNTLAEQGGGDEVGFGPQPNRAWLVEYTKDAEYVPEAGNTREHVESANALADDWKLTSLGGLEERYYRRYGEASNSPNTSDEIRRPGGDTSNSKNELNGPSDGSAYSYRAELPGASQNQSESSVQGSRNPESNQVSFNS